MPSGAGAYFTAGSGGVSHSCARASVGLHKKQNIASRRELLTLNRRGLITFTTFVPRIPFGIIIDTPFERSSKCTFLIRVGRSLRTRTLIPGSSAHAQ